MSILLRYSKLYWVQGDKNLSGRSYHTPIKNVLSETLKGSRHENVKMWKSYTIYKRTALIERKNSTLGHYTKKLSTYICTRLRLNIILWIKVR